MTIPVIPTSQTVEPVSPRDLADSGEGNEKARQHAVPPSVCTTYTGSVVTDSNFSESDHSTSTTDQKTVLASQRTAPSFSRILFAHIGAAMALFLATTDATIVSTSLPTIAADLHASESQYTWVGVAYLLTQTAFQPIYGRLSDIIGRKITLFFSISVFMIGSLLCGISPNATTLCIFRAIAGMGAGGIVHCVWLITSEIVEEHKRAQWSTALSVTWSASAVAGPVLGGLFSDGGSVSWRWAFFMTLPIGFLAAVILALSLKGVELPAPSPIPWSHQLAKFDILGLVAFMAGTTCLMLGFSLSSEMGWSSPTTLGCLIGGVIILILGCIHEGRTTTDALFPGSLFSNLTTCIILIISFLHNFAFNAGTFYLVVYYQAVNGSSALQAGLQMFPYSLGSSLASIPAAWIIGFCQKRTKSTVGQNFVITAGLVISAVGFGLLITLHESSPLVVQELFPLICGIGIGMLFHAPYQVLTRCLGSQNLASATSAFFLVRFTGATSGLAIAGAIFNEHLLSSSAVSHLIRGAGSSIDLRSLRYINPPEVRNTLLHAATSGLKSIWIVCAPCLGFSALLSLLLKKAPVDIEAVYQDEDKTQTSNDVP